MREIMVKRFWIVLVLVLGFGTNGHGAQYNAFKDWYVNCSDALICEMEANPRKSAIYALGFKRGKAANAALDLILELEGELAKDSTIKLSIPGQSMAFEVDVGRGRFNHLEWEFSLDVSHEQLLSALKAGNTIEIQAVTTEKTIKSSISLSGITASMLFIDEVQGRVGRIDALHAKGNKPAAAVVTRVSELESKTVLPGSVAQVWNGSSNACDEEGNDVIAQYGGLRIDLDKESHLFLLPCGTPGAYNAPYIAIMLDVERDKTRNISFPVMGARGPTTMDIAYNVNWDDKKSQLDAFFKGRGIGDCGSKYIWQWNGDGIYGAFELVEERQKDDCDEKFGKFPLIWPPEEL